MQLILCDGIARQTRDILTADAAAAAPAAPPAPTSSGKGPMRIVKRPAPQVVDGDAIMHAAILYTALPMVDLVTFFADAVFALEGSCADAKAQGSAHGALTVALEAIWAPADAAVKYYAARRPGEGTALAKALDSVQAAMLRARSVLLQIRGLLASRLARESTIADEEVASFIMPEDCDLYGLRPLFQFDASPRRPPHRHDPAYHDRRFPRGVEMLDIRRKRLNMAIGHVVA
jgi:hypothetical protein